MASPKPTPTALKIAKGRNTRTINTFQRSAMSHSIGLNEPGNYEAIDRANKIRRDHNGIGGVYLYLGHDGDNACEFKDIDGKSIVKMNGSTLLDAVDRCEGEWRHRKMLAEMGKNVVWLCMPVLVKAQH